MLPGRLGRRREGVDD